MSRPTLGPGAGIEEIELVGEVEGFDTREKEVYVRTDKEWSRVVAYTPDTRVIIEGREHPIIVLRSGDLVAMQLHKDARGNDYTNLIRVRNRVSEQAWVGEKSTIEPLEGTVEHVDLQRGVFEVRPRLGETTRVHLPYNPSQVFLWDVWRDSKRKREEIKMLAVKKLLFMSLGMILFVGFAACQKEEGPAEKAGKEVDEAVEQLGEKVEEAGDKVEDATQR